VSESLLVRTVGGSTAPLEISTSIPFEGSLEPCSPTLTPIMPALDAVAI
jgi:hypothetical protein